MQVRKVDDETHVPLLHQRTRRAKDHQVGARRVWLDPRILLIAQTGQHVIRYPPRGLSSFCLRHVLGVEIRCPYG